MVKIQLLAVMGLLMSSVTAQTPTVGTSVKGDFDGNRSSEFAFLSKTKEGYGNPIDGGVADEYSIVFTSNSITPISLGCCEARLINEGDLTKSDTDELSVYQAPMNGNTYAMITYSLINGSWKVLFDPILIPTGGDVLSNEELQSRVFFEEGSVFYYDVDVNDENFGLIKKKAQFNLLKQP